MMVVANELKYVDELEDLDDFPLRNGLSYKARREAEFLYTIARGVMLITGQPGSGKDLFGIGLSAMNKYYFNRKILLDFIPKRAFGEYTLFNARVMMDEINKMARQAGVEGFEEGKDNKEKEDIAEDLGKKWVENEGETILKGSVLYLSELKRYCYNRNPHNPFNKFIGSICTVWRHLDLLILGTHVQKHEIDQYSYLAYVSHWAKCSWSISQPDTSDVKINRGAFIGASNVYNVEGKPIIMHVDGAKPRAFLNGKRFYDLYHTKSMVNLKPVLRREM